MSFFEDLPSLSPVQFFGVTCECLYTRNALKAEKNHLLPSLSDMLAEECFAQVYAGWNMQKLSFLVISKIPLQEVNAADFRKGDSIEIFIDTRDLKTKNSISRFCHHFLFFPAQVQNFHGREITRFHGDDVHRLCHPEDLQVSVSLEKTGYSTAIEIPSACLHGYDPLSFNRLGFTYRINRSQGAPQYFAVTSEEYVIEQHPSTWGTLQLIKE